MLEATIAQIAPLDQAAMEECQRRLDNLIKPLNSLGAFEKLACQMAGIFGVAKPQMPPCSLMLAAGEVRRPDGMTLRFAEHVGAKLVCFDSAERQGATANAVRASLEAGIRSARAVIEMGPRILGVGVLGETSDCAMNWDENSLDLPIESFAGDSKVAALAGVILEAAAKRSLVVLDDAPTLQGALLAVQIAPLAKYYLVGSQIAKDEKSAMYMRRLDLKAHLDVDLNLGEGTGAVLGISLLKASMHVLNDMRTFGEAEVPVAEDGPGALVQKGSNSRKK